LTTSRATPADATPGAQQSFGALRHPGFRPFFLFIAAAMTGDFIEHVISYWVLFQKFHSPALAGFAVVSHWLPFLLFSIYSGALADRFDPRRIVQAAMVVFMGVSIAWGVLFASGKLEMWHAMVLLVMHGFAGVLWNPSVQLLLHDIVGPAQLQSAVRLTATARNLGMLAGPAIGGGLLLALGPEWGIFVNALFYLPMLVWMWKAPYGPKFRKAGHVPARAVRGLADVVTTLRAVRDNPVILSMMLLAGGASFFIGNSYGAQMPEFARDLGHGDPGVAYSMLLAADAFGALAAGVALESRGLLNATPRMAFILAFIWCGALASFALTGVYQVALAVLFVAGFVELAFNAMSQTLVQLNAPADIRGRVIGVYMMASLGMRTFSGITVGLVGAAIGIHFSLAAAAAVLIIVAGTVFALLKPKA
jgi:MFS family permease